MAKDPLDDGAPGPRSEGKRLVSDRPKGGASDQAFSIIGQQVCRRTILQNLFTELVPVVALKGAACRERVPGVGGYVVNGSGDANGKVRRSTGHWVILLR